MVWTNLHHLCGAQTNSSNTEAIFLHCLSHPEEISEVDDQGSTPLTLEVIRSDPREAVIKALLQANPQALLKKNAHDSTSLHLAICPEVDPNIIRLMIDACQSIVFEKDKEGLMPLHIACRYCPCNEEVIGILIEANPDALLSRTRMGNIVQKKNGVSPSLFPIEVVRHNRHAVLDGVTSSSWKESQIKSTVERRLEERSQQLRDGSYPLHMAIASGAPQQVLEMLIKEAPDVASKTDKFGRTCLHLAVRNHGWNGNDAIVAESRQEKHAINAIEAVKLFHSFDRSQVKASDKASQLPLHTACEVGCSIDVVKYLIHAHPDAIHAKNKDGKRPLEVAIASEHCSKDLIDFLMDLSGTADIEVAQ